MSKRRTYTPEEKAEALAIVASDGLAEAVRQTGISKGTLASWKRRSQWHGPLSSESKPGLQTQPESLQTFANPEEPPTQPDGLTHKQWLFCVAYVANGGNATDAARSAGYEGDNNVLAVQGHTNLRNPKIRAAIDRLMSERLMSREELHFRIADDATADMADFVSDDNPELPDLKKAKARGVLHLIKELQTKTTITKQGDIVHDVKIKLVDKQAAKRDLDKIYQRIHPDEPDALGSEGNPLTIVSTADLIGQHYGVRPGKGPDIDADLEAAKEKGQGDA